MLGFGICRLTPREYYSTPTSDMLRMTNAINKINEIKYGSYKRKYSKKHNEETLKWLKEG